MQVQTLSVRGSAAQFDIVCMVSGDSWTDANETATSAIGHPSN